MRKLNELHDAQRKAALAICEERQGLLYAEMGGGKTVTMLTSILWALERQIIGNKAVVFAPVKVAQDVWAEEHKQWEHLSHLKVSIAAGLPEETRVSALLSDADVVVLSIENLQWFGEWLRECEDIKGLDWVGAYCNGLGFYVDETTKLKAGGVRFKRIRKYLPKFSVRCGATGTPVSENFQQLFYQIMLVDCGKALGRNRDAFLNEYFYPTDFNRRNWALKDDGAERITAKIAHLILELPTYRDAELPPLNRRQFTVRLQGDAPAIYRQMEKHYCYDEVEAPNAAVLTAKLQQIANGFLYHGEGDARTVTRIHYDKERAVCQLIGIEQAVVAYQFEETRNFLVELFKQEGITHAVLGANRAHNRKALTAFRAGELQVLMLHPKSAGHGLDLACAHRLIIVSPSWSHDETEQLIARIHRRGQAFSCDVWELLSSGTVEEFILTRERDKGQYARDLRTQLDALKNDANGI